MTVSWTSPSTMAFIVPATEPWISPLHDAVDPHTAIAAAAGHQLRHGKRGTVHDAGADEQDLRQDEEDEEDGDDGASAQTLADAHDAGVGSHPGR